LSKILGWAKRPVPFCIPTTGGQQKSLPWIKNSPWDNPYNASGTVIRMAFEVLTFRSLFRNTAICLKQEGPKVGYSSAKWLWLFALMFHYSFLLILLRHLRLFLNPVPMPIEKLEFMDSTCRSACRFCTVGQLIVAALLFCSCAGVQIPRSTSFVHVRLLPLFLSGIACPASGCDTSPRWT
jgi:nitrate reductase gamma subunit